MSRLKKNLMPSVESMEQRSLPSAALPVLTTRTVNAVVVDISRVVGTLAKNNDFARAASVLTRAASKIPYGAHQLAPELRADLESARMVSPSTAAETRKELLGDVYQYVINGAQNGTFRVVGAGSAIYYVLSPGQGPGGTIGNPPPTANADAVNIQNATGQAIQVTVRLNTSGNPPQITQTIPATGQTTLPFNFGTSTNAFMTMSVSTANGSRPPYPLTNYQLSKPINGYFGTLFTVTILGQYFAVSTG
jgi:hypothetical protein